MDDLSVTELPWGIGGIVGAVAWILTYLTSYALVVTELEVLADAMPGDLAGEMPGGADLAGWVFYNAHSVDVVLSDIPVAGDHSMTFVGGTTGVTPLMMVVPPAVLTAAGITMAKLHGIEDPKRGALWGLTIVPAYLALTAVGTVVFTTTVVDVSAGPPLVESLLIAGILYPTLFGTAGAAVATR